MIIVSYQICRILLNQKWKTIKELWPRLWIRAVDYLILGTKDVKYRDYFLRDIRKAAVLDPVKNVTAPFKSFVNCDKISAVIKKDIREFNNLPERRPEWGRPEETE